VVRPDSDAWLLAMLLRTIFTEGLFDAAALDNATTGWRKLRDAVVALDSLAGRGHQRGRHGNGPQPGAPLRHGPDGCVLYAPGNRRGAVFRP